MIRCALCPARLQHDHLCSDLAVLTLHWMANHKAEYLKLHPEATEVLKDI